MDQPNGAEDERTRGMLQQVGHERVARGIELDAGLERACEQSWRDIDAALRKALGEVRVQLDLETIGGMLPEARACVADHGLEGSVLPRRRRLTEAEAREEPRRALRIARAHVEIQIRRRPLPAFIESQSVQRCPFERNEPNAGAARLLVDLSLQHREAILMRGNLRPLVGEKTLEVRRYRQLTTLREKTRDAMHAAHRACDAPVLGAPPHRHGLAP